MRTAEWISYVLDHGHEPPEPDDNIPVGFASWAEWAGEQDPAMFEE